MEHSFSSQHRDRVFIGIGFALMAFFLFAAMNGMVKFVSANHTPIEIAFYRCVMASIPMFIFMLIKTPQDLDLRRVKMPGILALRVIIGISAMVVMFESLQHLPLSTATMIFLLATLMTPAAAHFILHERMGVRRWAAIIFGLGGAALVLGPSAEGKVLGVILAVAASFGHTGAQISLRMLKGESPYVLTFTFTLGGALLLSPFIFMNGLQWFHSIQDFLWICLITVVGTIGQYFLAHAFKNASASIISPFALTGIVWATLLDIIIWSYVPGWPVFVGAGFIIIAKLYFAYREYQLQKIGQEQTK